MVKVVRAVAVHQHYPPAIDVQYVDTDQGIAHVHLQICLDSSMAVVSLAVLEGR